jgi:hypothetical protein
VIDVQERNLSERELTKSGWNYEPLFKPVSAAQFGATGVPWQLIQLQGRSWDGPADRGEGVDKEPECCQDQDPGCAPRRRGAVLDWERWWAAARLFQDACIISTPAAAPTFAP